MRAKASPRRAPAGRLEQHLALRERLMRGIARAYRESGLTQVEAAAKLGISQPRLNSLLKERVELFSLDALVKIAALAGLSVRLTVRKA